MIPVKEVARQFRTPSWNTPEQIDAFVTSVGPLTAADLSKQLLPLLLDKNLAIDSSHRLRCATFAALVERSPSPEIFAPLVRALKSGDPVVRAQLVSLLPKVNDPASHGELCQLLGSQDVELRRAAAQVLKQIAGKTAIQVLSDLARDSSFAGRVEAIEIVAPKAAHHAIGLLAAVLDRGKPPERALALKFLGDAKLMAKDIGSCLRLIAPHVKDPDERTAAQAASSYGALSPSEEDFWRVVGELFEDTNPLLVKAAVEGLRRFPTRRSIEALSKKLRVGPHSVRMAALESLELINTEDVLPPVLEALGHNNLHVRTKAAQVLAQLSSANKVDVAQSILWLLRSRDVNLRRMAVEIARKVGDLTGELAPKLLRYLRDEDWWVRERVIDALAEMTGPGVARHVAEYLNDPSDVVRRYAVNALVKLGDPRALGALVRVAMNDADWWVREQAIEGIGTLKDERAVPYLIDIMNKNDELRLPCVLALKSMGAKNATPYVVRLASSKDADLRLAVVQFLSDLDERGELAVMRACENDDDPRIKSAAREALGRWNLIEDVNAQVMERAAGLLDRMLAAMVKAEGDDLILAAGRAPYIKRMGRVVPLSQSAFSDEQVRAILFPVISHDQRKDLELLRDVDFSYEVKGSSKTRFRGHIFTQMSGLSAVFRVVKNEIPNIEKLGLPPVMTSFASLKNGLVLIGGPTGSGKSTTLAALIDHINRHEARHIVTLEDPIEVVHTRNQSLINQRELGAHTKSFSAALRSTLRQDPDVILVGEMRDLQTISFAVTAAETGHLVFGTVHTVSADSSVERLVNAFPAGQQPQVRSMLAESLRAVACQHLLRRKDAPGRVPAIEIMINNDAVANLIRKNKTFQISSVIATSKDLGMQSMDSELMRLVREGRVDVEDAYMKAIDKKPFEQLLQGTKPTATAQSPRDGLRTSTGAHAAPRTSSGLAHGSYRLVSALGGRAARQRSALSRWQRAHHSA